MEPFLLGGVLAVAAVGSAGLVQRYPLGWAIALLAWLPCQQLMGPLFWGATHNVAWSRELILVKEAAIVGAFVGVIPSIAVRIRGLHPAIVLAGFYGLIVVLYLPFVVAAQPLDQTLRGVRGLTLPIVILVIGYAMTRRPLDYSRLVTAAMVIGIVVGGFAVAERFLIRDSFWLGLDLRGYWVEVKGLTANTISPLGLPGNFYAYFVGPGIAIRRAVGSLGDPLGLSYFLLAPLLLSVAGLAMGNARRPVLNAMTALTCAVAIGLSLSRQPLVIAVTGSLMIVGWSLAARRPLARAAAGAMPAVLLIAVFVGMVPLSHHIPANDPNWQQYVDPSLETHLDKLTSVNWPRVLIGDGPGRHGILTSAYTSTGTEVSSSEDLYLDIASQVGMAGAIAFGGTLILTAIAHFRTRRTKAGERSDLMAMGVCALGLAAAGIFSPQLLVVTSLGTFWLLMGAGLRSTEP